MIIVIIIIIITIITTTIVITMVWYGHTKMTADTRLRINQGLVAINYSLIQVRCCRYVGGWGGGGGRA